MKASVVIAALLLAPALAAPAVGQFPMQVPGTDVYLDGAPDRVFDLVMQGHTINLQGYPGDGLPAGAGLVLEAYLGDRVQFTVAVPATAEPHTFHLHGHPWFAPTVGRMVDTWLLHPGDVHSFSVVAGGIDGNAGDWMFHCHLATHAASGMWGIFRVYPYRSVIPPILPGPQRGGAFDVHLDRLGVPVDGAHLMVQVDGKPLPAQVTPLGGGAYRVGADLPATGVLVVTAHHPDLGVSVARVGLGGTPVPPLTAQMDAMAHAA